MAEGFFFHSRDMPSKNRLNSYLRFYSNNLASIEASIPELDDSTIADVIVSLRDSSEAIMQIGENNIRRAIDTSFGIWLDPDSIYRKEAAKNLAATLGYSHEMSGLLLNNMFSLLKRDFIRYEAPEKKGGIAVGIFPETPGPQIISIASALLAGMPILCKSSLAEPTFTPLYIGSLIETESRLERCIASLPWEGGTLSNKALEKELYSGLGKGDAAFVFGSEEAKHGILRFISPQAGLYAYTRGISIISIGKETLTEEKLPELLESCSYSIALYNRSACVSPQIIFAETGGEISPSVFSGLLGDKLLELSAVIPIGDPGSAYGRLVNANMAYEMLEMQGLIEYHPQIRDSRLLGAVVYLPNGRPELPEGGNARTVTVCPAEDISSAMWLLENKLAAVHSAGLALPDDRYAIAKREYEKRGIRVTPISEILNLSFRDYPMLK